MNLLKVLLGRNRRVLYPGGERVPEPLLREAFAASGEKRFELSSRLYPRLFGPDWDYVLLGFAYVKVIDNVVDVERDAEKALAYMVRQRRLMEACYAGAAPDGELPRPDHFGRQFFLQDARAGAPLRSCFEDVFAVMEFDVRRRGRVLSHDELDAHLVATGEPGIRFLTTFMAPEVELPPPYLALASRAYLWADSLLDLEEDLADGLINVPAEAIERFELTPAVEDAALPLWVAEQAGRTMGYFDQALAQTDELEHPALILFCKLYLGRKRKKLLRLLEKRGIPAAA